MTVCLAAICQWLNVPIVVGCSDRMLTSGDIQFQPPASKIYGITKSIYALVAGDAGVHSEVFPKVAERVNALIQTKPKEWVKVETVASFYGEEVLNYKKRTLSRLVLEPLGLTWSTFITRQKDFSPEWLDDISHKMLELKAEHRVLIAGLDATGAHIWIVDGQGKPSCADKVGFAAIGIGKRHAESEFMFTKHTPSSGFPETLLRIYAAKKRAEVAPGVGDATDLVVVPNLGGGNIMIDEELQGGLPQLAATYRSMIEEQEEAKERANKIMADFFEEEMKKVTEQQANPTEQLPPTQPLSSQPSDSGMSELKK